MLTERKLSVIIPCYNDRGSIHEMYRRVNAVMVGITPNYEFVYVNDASPDNAMEVLREIAARDARFIVADHTRNFGADAAYSTGLNICTGDAAILIDGDIQDPPELFPELVKKWIEGYEVIYGIHTRRQERLFKRIGRRLFYRLLKYISYLDIPLDAGNFCLIDRKVVNALNQLPETDRFLRGLRAWVGFRHTGIPYHRRERFAGRSGSTLAVYLRESRRGIFSFSYLPIELISYVAAFMSLLSALAILVYVALAIVGGAPRGFLTQIVLMLVLSAMQFLSLAVIAEYVNRIFQESKRRPYSLIRETLNAPNRSRP